MLADTETIFLKAYGELLQRYGKPFPPELQQKCIGKSKVQLHELLINEVGIKNKTVDELAAEGAAIQNRMYETDSIALMPGTEILNLRFKFSQFSILIYYFYFRFLQFLILM